MGDRAVQIQVAAESWPFKSGLRLSLTYSHLSQSIAFFSPILALDDLEQEEDLERRLCHCRICRIRISAQGPSH